MTHGLPVVKVRTIVVQALPSPPLPFTYLLIANKSASLNIGKRGENYVWEKLDKLV